MSSFFCEKCNTKIVDTQYGYVTGCKHYQIEKQTHNLIALKHAGTWKGDDLKECLNLLHQHKIQLEHLNDKKQNRKQY